MTQTTTLPSPTSSYQISWEILPDDFVLPDEPVDNINQPSLAAALTDALVTHSKLGDNALTTTNYGLCTRLNEKFVVKAPDWAYIPQISVSRDTVIRSYTPKLQGDLPAIVMEFLSDTDGKEYSVKPTYPPGKWFFYEKILKVPNYIIFDPFQGTLEYYRLDSSGNYDLQTPNQSGKHWIEEIQLYLGVWQGMRELRQGYWLRWWTEDEELLLWGTELAQQERQRAETERQRAETERQRAETERQRAETERQRAETEHQRAETERQRAETLAAFLREQGFNPDDLS